MAFACIAWPTFQRICAKNKNKENSSGNPPFVMSKRAPVSNTSLRPSDKPATILIIRKLLPLSLASGTLGTGLGVGNFFSYISPF